MNEWIKSSSESLDNVTEEDDKTEPQLIPVCKCLKDELPQEPIKISARKIAILTTAARTESYLRDRRINDLIRFLLTKLLSDLPDRPSAYFEKLLNDCMLFRAGHGTAPVLYEDRHLQAVVKSFDPGDRGWLSAGQIHRLYNTLDIVPDKDIEDKVSTETVLQKIKKCQERQLFHLLVAGIVQEDTGSNATESGTCDSKETE